MTTNSSASNGPSTSASNAAVATNTVTVKIPTFWPSDPKLSYAQVEVLFSPKQITAQSTKFFLVVAALSPQAPYRGSRHYSFACYYESIRCPQGFSHRANGSVQAKKDTTVYTCRGVGGRKTIAIVPPPTATIWQLSRGLFRELFLQRLPSNVQVGLLSHSDKPWLN